MLNQTPGATSPCLCLTNKLWCSIALSVLCWRRYRKGARTMFLTYKIIYMWRKWQWTVKDTIEGVVLQSSLLSAWDIRLWANGLNLCRKISRKVIVCWRNVPVLNGDCIAGVWLTAGVWCILWACTAFNLTPGVRTCVSIWEITLCCKPLISTWLDLLILDTLLKTLVWKFNVLTLMKPALLSWFLNLLAISATTNQSLAACSSRVLNLLLMFFSPVSNNSSVLLVIVFPLFWFTLSTVPLSLTWLLACSELRVSGLLKLLAWVTLTCSSSRSSEAPGLRGHPVCNGGTWFIYLGFYVTFNTVLVKSRWVVGRAEEVLYCKLPTNGKQLPAFPLEARSGTEPRPQRPLQSFAAITHQ